jgi:hypothetical protein
LIPIVGSDPRGLISVLLVFWSNDLAAKDGQRYDASGRNIVASDQRPEGRRRLSLAVLHQFEQRGVDAGCRGDNVGVT